MSKVANVLTYLKTNNEKDFNKLEGEKVFNQTSKTLSILHRCVFYVDWRQKENSIVEDCESIIKTGLLKANINYSENTLNTLQITYKNQLFKTTFTNTRDPALRLLNKALTPDYEIRFCLNTHGSDTLAFIILSKNQWHKIEQKIDTSELNKIFEPIHDDTKMFEREFS